MSKTLYLVRHAKSSWDDPSLQDFDRPLNKRGKRDAPEMGHLLAKQSASPDYVISSPAKRAKKTAEAIAEAVGYPSRKIQWEQAVYHAEPPTLLKCLQQVSESYASLMVVGHNPGLTDFYNELCDEEIDNIVTTGIVCLTLAVDQWIEVTLDKTATLRWYDYPKRKPSK